MRSLVVVLFFWVFFSCSGAVFGAEIDDMFALDDGSDSAIEVYDPMESINRKVFEFNVLLDKSIFIPLSNFYSHKDTSWIEVVLRNFFANLQEISNAVGFLINGDVKMAVNVLFRFYINTLVGFFGCLDVATALGLPKSEVDLELLLAKSGMQQGPYFVLPFLGPSSMRGVVASMVKYMLNPLAYLADSFWLQFGLKVIENVLVRLDYAGLELQSNFDVDSYVKWRSSYYQRMGFISDD